MKQRHGGPKLINWHRPLAPWELKHKHLRFRDANHTDDHLITPEEWQEAQGCVDDLIEGTDDSMSNFDFWDHFCFQVKEKLAETKEESAFQTLGLQKGNQAADYTFERKPHENLDAQLEYLDSDLQKEDIPLIIDSAMVNDQTWPILQAWANIPPNSVTLEDWHSTMCIMILFSTVWVRSPLSVEAAKGNHESLIAHLFETYPAPAVYRKSLYKVQLTAFGMNRPQQFKLYLYFSQGISVIKYLKAEGLKLPKRFIHNLNLVNPRIDVTKANVESYVLSIISSKRVAKWISNSKYMNNIDPLDNSPWTTSSDLLFIKSTAIWLSLHEGELSTDQVKLIFQWASHMEDELGERFQWKGRTVKATVRAARKYKSELESLRFGRYQLPTYNYDWEYTDKKGRHWQFIELTSGKKLFEETKSMHHCVATYGKKCLSGDAAIVRLLKDESPVLTIEVNPTTREVVQVRGKYNRKSSVYEEKVIYAWKEKVLFA